MLGNKLLSNMTMQIQSTDSMTIGVFYASSISLTVKVVPLVLPQDQWELRSKFVLKFTGLPPGTTFIDLIDIVSAVGAKSWVIPKGLKAYQPRPFAYIAFASESKMLQALKTSYSLVNSDLTWVTTKQKLCGI